jgi:hypothetical protein
VPRSSWSRPGCDIYPLGVSLYESLTARPPTTTDLIDRLIRRNKTAFIAAGAITAAQILGMIGITIGLLRAEEQRRAAEDAQRVAAQRFSPTFATGADNHRFPNC